MYAIRSYYGNNGQLSEAFEMLQEAIERLPDSSVVVRDIAYLQLAVCSMQLGEMDEAERYTNIIRARHENSSLKSLETFPV